jgi:hypothetical protein
MAEEHDPKHLDKRTSERYLRMGVIEEKAYERHIKGLPDVADKGVPVETLMLDDELEDDDLEDEEDEQDEELGEDALPEDPGA